jgi:DUF4097 and DUF4098 domain-containing protein YvlB
MSTATVTARPKTIRRDSLLKKFTAAAAAGKVEVMYPASDWMKGRVSTGYGDFIEGMANLTAKDFDSCVGRATQDPDGMIHLYVHSNSTMRIRFL